MPALVQMYLSAISPDHFCLVLQNFTFLISYDFFPFSFTWDHMEKNLQTTSLKVSMVILLGSLNMSKWGIRKCTVS